MSAPDLTAEMMRNFRGSGAEKFTTILLGAGASTSSGLPDWDEFAARLLVTSGSVTTSEAARVLVAHQDPLLVAEAAHAAAGDRWNRVLQRSLYEGVETLDPSPLHLAAAGHLLTGDPADSRLVTLNFDVLLEQAIEMDGGRAQARVDGETTDSAYEVHHLHGIITPSKAEQVVLRLTDFTDLLSSAHSWQLDYLQESIDKGALVIAGTSYRDPDLRQWLQAILPGRPDGHAAVVLLARQGFSLTKDQFQAVQHALVSQWEAIGMRPVLLEDHADAAQIIRELRHVNTPGYVAPQERARTIWRSHTDRFLRLQTEYADLLAGDADVLRDALATERMNLTLWLADGEGNLARWATQDRYYRGVTDLRMVETGHDSRWIAGKALASEEILFQDIEGGSTGRWRSVLALPIPVGHPTWPTMVTGVVSIGLPEHAGDYEDSKFLWGDALLTLGDNWGRRLVDATSW
ncbi:SIR2 family protein [Georgenia sp. MJ170]|uniref:SIR2 family protein n=1 Tax=Georgenia sunbinii TaxID=3117728 RepID=UPI002F26B6EB